MTRDKILSDLFTSKDFTSCISKMKPENLQDELKAEVALILCEIDEFKLIGLAQRKELKFYTVRIILNLIQSNTSPFYKKFRGNNYLKIVDIPTGGSAGLLQAAETGYTESTIMNDDFYLQTRDTCFSVVNDSLVDNTLAYDLFEDNKKDKAIAEIENLYWYDREILKLYVECGTYRKVEEVTGIPFESIYQTVSKNCKLIRKKIA